MTRDGLRKWMWVFLAALIALQFFFVRQLVSALLLLAAGFAAIFALIAAAYLLHRAWQRTLVGIGKRAPSALGFARRSLILAEELSRKPFRRPRSEPVQ